MRSVKHGKRLTADNFSSCRKKGCGERFFHRFIRNIKPAKRYSLYCRERIFDLIFPTKRQRKLFFLIYICSAAAVALQNLKAGNIGHSIIFGVFFDDGHNLIFLICRNDRREFFYYTTLFRCYFLHRITQNCRMVKPHFSNDRRAHPLKSVGGVQSAAETRFGYYNIALFIRKI